VTGGTGDIKPQLLTVAGANAVATTVYNVQQVSLPVAKVGFQKSKAQIVEILKVYFLMGTEDYANAADKIFWAFLTTNTNRANATTANVGNSVQDFDDSRTFAYAQMAVGATTSGVSQGHVIERDLTDQNGNGFLVATDQIDFVYSGIGQATGISTSVKILYRYVNVGIQEYVGIVQGQK